ncbi:MAG: hypothetical protein J5898_05765 [Lachnospiraceae bacterium]|nr:hypothetical protein [Lachnospiraceae bacterium]
MKRRHRAKSDIVIDLTSLLDVVFIVLLVVICRQHILTDSQQEKMGDVEAREALAQEKYELYMDQLETADQLNQYVWAVSVYSSYNDDKLTERRISMLREGQEIEGFELRGENVSGVLEAFRKALESYITEHAEQPVILSLNENDEDILYRDEKAINRIFSELASEYDNVYIKPAMIK